MALPRTEELLIYTNQRPVLQGVARGSSRLLDCLHMNPAETQHQVLYRIGVFKDEAHQVMESLEAFEGPYCSALVASSVEILGQ